MLRLSTVSRLSVPIDLPYHSHSLYLNRSLIRKQPLSERKIKLKRTRKIFSPTPNHFHVRYRYPFRHAHPSRQLPRRARRRACTSPRGDGDSQRGRAGERFARGCFRCADGQRAPGWAGPSTRAINSSGGETYASADISIVELDRAATSRIAAFAKTRNIKFWSFYCLHCLRRLNPNRINSLEVNNHCLRLFLIVYVIFIKFLCSKTSSHIHMATKPLTRLHSFSNFITYIRLTFFNPRAIFTRFRTTHLLSFLGRLLSLILSKFFYNLYNLFLV